MGTMDSRREKKIRVFSCNGGCFQGEHPKRSDRRWVTHCDSLGNHMTSLLTWSWTHQDSMGENNDATSQRASCCKKSKWDANADLEAQHPHPGASCCAPAMSPAPITGVQP